MNRKYNSNPEVSGLIGNMSSESFCDIKTSVHYQKGQGYALSENRKYDLRPEKMNNFYSWCFRELKLVSFDAKFFLGMMNQH